MERMEFANGDFWVHARYQCESEHCPIHNSSGHPLCEAPMELCKVGRIQGDGNYWEDVLVMRQCDHGYPHTDPDSLAYLRAHTADPWEDDHVCDGCCQPNVDRILSDLTAIERDLR